MLPRICSSGEAYRDGQSPALRRELRLPGSSATSRLRWWARPASNPARPRIPTAPVASC
jgi:hypothetical protein